MESEYPLNGFLEFAVTEGNLSRSSAELSVRAIRRAFLRMDDADLHDPKMLSHYSRSLTRALRAQFGMAWKCMRAYSASLGDPLPPATYAPDHLRWTHPLAPDFILLTSLFDNDMSKVTWAKFLELKESGERPWSEENLQSAVRVYEFLTRERMPDEIPDNYPVAPKRKGSMSGMPAFVVESIIESSGYRLGYYESVQNYVINTFVAMNVDAATLREACWRVRFLRPEWKPNRSPPPVREDLTDLLQGENGSWLRAMQYLRNKTSALDMHTADEPDW